MLNPIEIKFKLDKTIKRAHSTELMIKSHDINVIEFHISFDGLELTADHTVKVLSVFNDSQSQTNVECEIVDGKAIYRPDTNLISQYEQVTSYVYVYLGDQSLDVREFTYSVDLSKIDETALKVKEVYDQSYSDLLADFEQALQDYKDSLPQASDLRAEVDALLEIVEGNESARVDAEATRKSNETERVSNESERESAEVIRLANELNRVNAETVRSEFYEGFDGELANLQTEIAKKADRKQEEWITPTLLNGWIATDSIAYPVRFYKDEVGVVRLKGRVHGGDGVIFVLPVGYRVKNIISGFLALGTASDTPAKVNVTNAGNVVCRNGTTGIYLDAIAFRAEV